MEMASARPEIGILERSEKRARPLHFHLQEIRRVPTNLLERLRVDVAELEPVTSADDAGAGRLPSQAELGREGIAVAIEIDRGKVIHFVRCGYGGVAQTVVDLTVKSGRALQASPAKYCCSNQRKLRCPFPIAAE